MEHQHQNTWMRSTTSVGLRDLKPRFLSMMLLLICIFVMVCQSSSAPPEPVAIPGYRQTLGRMIDSQEYATYLGTKDKPVLRSKQELAQALPDPRNEAQALEWGSRSLRNHAPEKAIHYLKQVSVRPLDLEKHHLLALAYLQKADDGDIRDLLAALKSIEILEGHGYQKLSVLFNKALVLEKLHLGLQAQAAWQAYLDLETDPAWLQEAQERLNELKDRNGTWSHFESHLDEWVEAGHFESLYEAVRQFPQGVREEISFQLLAIWANLHLTGSLQKADRYLTNLQKITAYLSEINGDVSLLQHIQYLQNKDGAERSQLAKGHELFRVGWLAYEDVQIPLALDYFAEAKQYFRGSPFQELVVLYEGFSQIRNEVTQSHAFRTFKDLSRVTHSQVVKAYCLWMIGLYYQTKTNFDGANENYSQALNLFREAKEKQNEASMLYLLAQNYVYLGDSANQWLYFGQALELLSWVHREKWQSYILNQGAHWAVDEKSYLGARNFSKETILRIKSYGNPLSLAEAYISEARIHFKVGDLGKAKLSANSASAWIERIEDPTFRNQTRALLDTTFAKALAADNPEEALAYIESAMEYYEKVDTTIANAGLLVIKADILYELGAWELALENYAASMKIYEVEHASINDRGARFKYFDQARKAFDKWAELSLNLKTKFEPMIFERNELLRQTDFRNAYTLPAGDQHENVSLQGVVISYLTLPNQLLLSAEGSEGEEVVSIPVSFKDLEKTVQSFLGAIEQQVVEDIETHGSQLYQWLIKPITHLLNTDDVITIIPDQCLHRLPFAALIDEHGAWLIEAYALAYAPSRKYLRWVKQRSRGEFAEGVVAVGNPDFDPLDYPDFRPLIHAEIEVKNLQAFYPQVTQVLIGKEATIAAVRTASKNAGILHIAAHGVTSLTDPLASWLLLAPNPPNDPRGQLTVEEMTQWDFKKMRLVVIAACNSGKGIIFSNQGPINMAFPFLKDGVPSVITSLWKVNDEVSAEIFESFYANYRSGVLTAKCLQKSQLEIMKTSPINENPKNWAGLFLVGN